MYTYDVGTACMPSGDSSPWLGMNPGHMRVQTGHGDESLDSVYGVPTPMWATGSTDALHAIGARFISPLAVRKPTSVPGF